MRGTVRVVTGTDKSGSTTTGWLLTPRLVLAFFAEEAPQNIRVHAAKRWVEEDLSPPEMLNWPQGAGLEKPALGLLRLNKPHSGSLELSLSIPQPADLAILLHFPLGAPVLSVSFGRVESVGDVWLEHLADSQPGSAGGPLFDVNWRIIGVHCLGSATHEKTVNKALKGGALLPMLQSSNGWIEIARHHKLADTVASRRSLSAESPVQESPDDILVAAALCSVFDPEKLSPSQRALLETKVADPRQKRWSLPTRVRREALRSGGSLEELRTKLPPWRIRNQAERVIENVLKGPPYDLSTVADESLPLWIQASQWFSGIAPELPTAAEVSRVLERRRVRTRLLTMATSDFRGRRVQEETLRGWFAAEPPRPLTISGIGGMGKTALIAHFLIGLPERTLILWLDFDRADLAPDDARSIIAAIADQANIQLDGFKAPAAGDDWRPVAKELGGELARHTKGGAAPVLVLDSFEVAQYAEKYQQLWGVLETVAGAVPALRVIVSGRVAIEKLVLARQTAQSLALPGLIDDDVRDWLRLHKIDNSETVERVVALAKGIPLIVRLVFQLLESGESIDDVPADLPLKIVPGYLYRRILGRVQRKFLNIAKAAIILPFMTEQMIEPVLRDVLPLPDEPVASWFPELRKETALVTGADVLKVRPEVRAATLSLLESEDRAMVTKIEANAEKWLMEQDVNDPANAAEIVYLRLRRDDIRGAGRAWREGCGLHLKQAPDVLGDKARKWLNVRLGEEPAESATHSEPHEDELAERVKDLRSRGLYTSIAQVLREARSRGENSPLIFHDAYELRAAGRPKEALALLDRSGSGSGRVARDRAVLRALLLAESGDSKRADQALAACQASSFWDDRSDWEALSVPAARIRLNTDLELEVDAIESTALPPVHLLSPLDLILPRLQAQVNSLTSEFVLRLEYPKSFEELNAFREKIDEARKQARSSTPVPISGPDLELTKRLLELADRRWAVITGTTFLADAAGMARKTQPTGRLAQAVTGVFGLYVGDIGGLILIPPQTGNLFPMSRIAEIFGLLTTERQRRIIKHGLALGTSKLRQSGTGLISREYRILAYLAAPDPLETLVDSLAGKRPG